MAKIILKCPYLKPGGVDRGGFVRYIATRDGVEILPAAIRQRPATAKQHRLISEVLAAFPDAKDLFEYEDYLAGPTIGNASEFITQAMEYNYSGVFAQQKGGTGSATGRPEGAEAMGREGFVGYLAGRPGAEKVGRHGLFGPGDGPVDLAAVAGEVSDHPGNVWTPIVSLRREDAARLGYDNAANWKALLQKHADAFAKNLKIDPADLVWYAAFHNEAHHPHIHMLCYSRQPCGGYLTRDGIRGIKSVLARDIFRQDLVSVYQRQTLHRDETAQAAGEVLREHITQLVDGTLHSETLLGMMEALAGRLRFHGGRMAYGYLRPPLKQMVDGIVEELAKEPRVAAAYGKWCEARREVQATYSSEAAPAVPLRATLALAQNDTFKTVRNMVIDEAVKLMRGEFTVEQDSGADDGLALPGGMEPESVTGLDGETALVVEEPEPMSDPWEPDEEASAAPELEPGAMEPHTRWTKEYKQARAVLYGTKESPPDFGRAPRLPVQEAGTGSALGMAHARKPEAGIDGQQALYWLEEAAAQGSAIAAYQIGVLYAKGELAPRDDAAAARWLEQAAQAGSQYAQYALGKLYLFGDESLRNEQAAIHWLAASAAQGNAYAAFLLERQADWERGSVVLASSRLLCGLGRIFQQNHPTVASAHQHIDRKRMRKVYEKGQVKDGAAYAGQDQAIHPM